MMRAFMQEGLANPWWQELTETKRRRSECNLVQKEEQDFA